MAANALRNGDNLAIQGLCTHERRFEIKWTDGHESVFHYVWLRFNCACQACGDLDSGIGTVMMADIPEDVSPRDARIDDEGKLHVVWDYDGHESRFEPDWLRTHCYSETTRLARRHRPKLWDASFIDRLPSFDYQQIVDDDSLGVRHLRSVEVSREEFHNRLRLLMIKLNRPEARSHSLARGALA